MLHNFGMENCPPEILQGHSGGSAAGGDDPAAPLSDAAVVGVPSKVGAVYLLQPGAGGKARRTRVVLKVYYTNFGRYAVVSQDKVLCKDCGYINLRNCIVKKTEVKSLGSVAGKQKGVKSPTTSPSRNPLADPDRARVPSTTTTTTVAGSGFHSFEVIPRDGEGQALVIAVPDEEELEQWLNVLGPQDDASCRSPQVLEAPFRSTSPVEITNRRPLGAVSGPGMSSSPPRRHASLTKRPSSTLPSLAEEGNEE